jgi:hypothetical protein
LRAAFQKLESQIQRISDAANFRAA